MLKKKKPDTKDKTVYVKYKNRHHSPGLLEVRAVVTLGRCVTRRKHDWWLLGCRSCCVYLSG